LAAAEPAGSRRYAIKAGLVDFAGDGDGGLAEDMSDLGFVEARGVVLEGKVFLGFVEAEAAQAVSIGKVAEALELVLGKRGLQFVSDFDECHAGDYTSGGKWGGFCGLGETGCGIKRGEVKRRGTEGAEKKKDEERKSSCGTSAAKAVLFLLHLRPD
jgi:hypothetical protein